MKDSKYNRESIYSGDVCTICGKSSDIPHLECENKTQKMVFDYTKKMIELAEKYIIRKTFGPSDSDSRMTLNVAVEILSLYLDHEPNFDIEQVLKNENWWYIPHKWIGVIGFIVEKDSKKVFCLGSGLLPEWNAIEYYVKGKVAPVIKKS